jgi:hypothetical protein
VTLTLPWAEESDGGREESAGWRHAPFEAKAGEAGEGWGSRVRRRVEEKRGRERGAGFDDMDRHGTARTQRLWDALTMVDGTCLVARMRQGRAAGRGDTGASG